MKKTKIVATLGPASESATKIKSLIKAGVNVFRFNLKHNDKQWHSDKIELVQKCANEMGKPIAILLDLVGRDLRLGKIPNKGMLLKRGQEVIFADENNFKEGEIPVRNFIAYKNLKEGVRFSADSGSLFFKVFEVKERFFKANALKGGFLKENEGGNIPHLKVNLPALVESDLDRLSLAAKHDVDYVALSFVQTRDDIRILKREMEKLKVKAKTMAKIEDTLGIQNFDEILEEVDSIMVARGDLGIEVPIEKVPILQKEMIEKCRLAGKPVITATQMMESMLDNPIPSRADVSDVANSVYDYTDAVMLSGESAAGNYPVETVRQMSKILFQAERKYLPPSSPHASINTTDAMVQSALELTYFKPKEGAKPSAIVVLTETGRSVRLLSRLRPILPIIALTQSEKVRDELCLTWGVTPYYLNLGHERLELSKVFRFLKENQIVGKGQLLIILSGEITGEPGRTNMVTLKEVWE